ncbi:hypothetical protein [Clostridium cellulovorans]|uniref:Uncharacterized protein n=1 Tax=Clostridium cellulovorans (strain ATCC 35296 / DSM 3052 / OCM 3 / 743B) TaxID=573061 RepID=D9SVK5_CLOC7|nr:hypothetical protein [Clostridium cellulovorans]ADL51129.1 hypothetical protein Clocel_1376 [Clostridium cellulovorans 743B]
MLTVAVQIVSLVALAIFIVLSIWSFVILKKYYSQIKYNNYILEKICAALSKEKKDSQLLLGEPSEKNNFFDDKA